MWRGNDSPKIKPLSLLFTTRAWGHCVPAALPSWLGRGVHAQDAYHRPKQPAPSAITLLIMTSLLHPLWSSFYL